MKTINQMAFDAYQQDRALAPNRQTPDNYWMDWFAKGYREAEKNVEARINDNAVEAFCLAMHAGPTGCDRNKSTGCSNRCLAVEEFIRQLDSL